MIETFISSELGSLLAEDAMTLALVLAFFGFRWLMRTLGSTVK
jgi:hypothetical protein